MKTVILRDIVSDTSSVNQGLILFEIFKQTYLSDEKLVLDVDNDLSMSSSFLNASVGAFLDEYGLSSFKNMLKFKGSKTQFLRFSKYLESYNELYLECDK